MAGSFCFMQNKILPHLFFTLKLLVMKIRTTALAATLLCLITSCNSASEERNKSEDLSREVGMPDGKREFSPEAGYGSIQTDSTIQTPPDKEQKKQPTPSNPVPNPGWDKKIIKNAFLNFEVK